MVIRQLFFGGVDGVQIRAAATCRNGSYYSILAGYIGTTEKKMKTTVVYWGDIGITEKKMETAIVPKP